jgi:hypothetical protein
VLAEGLTAARAIEDDRERVRVLTELAEQALPGPLLAEALRAVRAIDDDRERASALATLAGQLPDGERAAVLEEVLIEARTIEIDWERALVLTELARQALPGPLIAEVLKAVRTLEDDENRASALGALAAQLPEEERTDVLVEALASASRIVGAYDRAGQLARLAEQLVGLDGARAVAGEWPRIVPVLAARPRPDLLRDLSALAPLIASVGGRAGIEAALAATYDATRWFK